MSIGLFSIARTALSAHQVALQTISHNIANAETPGYSRQEAVLSANTPVRMHYGNLGTGVNVETILRKRDILLDEGFRTANGSRGNAELRRDGLVALEGIFGEPTDAGMSNALDQFWNAWGDLATSPNSGAARSVVQQRGVQLAGLFGSYDSALTAQRSSSIDRLSNTVSQINQLAGQVAELNTRILTAESGSGSANDLRDQRDLLLDRLSGLGGTRVFPQSNGSVSVVMGNSTLVDGPHGTSHQPGVRDARSDAGHGPERPPGADPPGQLARYALTAGRRAAGARRPRERRDPGGPRAARCDGVGDRDGRQHGARGGLHVRGHDDPRHGGGSLLRRGHRERPRAGRHDPRARQHPRPTRGGSPPATTPSRRPATASHVPWPRSAPRPTR
jgi:hypothetical protein